MTPRPGGALVLGADYRALGVVRSLGRRGVPACVLREPGEPLAALSRYAGHHLPWPPGGEEDRVAFLLRLGRGDLAGWALVPSSDEAAALVARHHACLAEHFVLTSPAWETLRWAYDKRLTHALAQRAGVAAPRTERPGTVEAARALTLDYPVALKPAVKASFNALTAAKAWRADDPGELAARFARAAELLDPDLLLVQELVPGGRDAHLSFAALCDQGEVLASLTARRTRQYPADFGRASTLVETIECPEIVGPSRRLLEAIAYSGVVEVEYKRDPRDGVPKLLDMNPRVWGWHSLGARAGVDFPDLLWRWICGEPVPPARALPGVRWLRITTDTPTAVRELVGGRLPAGEYLRSLRGPRAAAIFAWDDPLPGLLEVPVLALTLARRMATGGAV